jgi:hypothetical protein
MAKKMDNPCWKGYKAYGTKMKDGKEVPNCVKEQVVYRCPQTRLEIVVHEQQQVFQEAEYQGRKVQLNKPMQGDVKKFKVYVKDPKTGNVKKVNFGHKGKGGEKTMRIRKDNPKARKSFRARHNCDNPGPKTGARYWSCRKW